MRSGHEVDLEDVAWWMTFHIHPSRIADYYGCSVAWLINKARRHDDPALAQLIRERAKDDGETTPVPLMRDDTRARSSLGRNRRKASA